MSTGFNAAAATYTHVVVYFNIIFTGIVAIFDGARRYTGVTVYTVINIYVYYGFHLFHVKALFILFENMLWNIYIYKYNCLKKNK